MADASNDFDLARALADAARVISSPGRLSDTLEAIVHAARASVPGFDEVGISVFGADGKPTTMSATSQLVYDLDAVQYQLEEGPCMTAMRDEPLVVAEDLAHEERWPRYVPHASDAGVRAQMGLQLSTTEETLGGLNFYSTHARSINPEASRHAELFAIHAALALSHARQAEHQDDAIRARQLIGQAVGMLTERYEITEDRAFHYLARVSAAGNLRLQDVARVIVDQGNLRAAIQDLPPVEG